MTCGIYCLRLNDGPYAYVGQSIDIERRWNAHKRVLDSRAYPDCHGAQDAMWLDAHDGSASFSFSVLEECAPERLNEREAYHAAKQLAEGVTLYNVAACGGAKVHSDDTFDTIEAVAAAAGVSVNTLAIAIRANMRLRGKDYYCLARRLRAEQTLTDTFTTRPIISSNGKCYPSIAHAAAELRIPASSLLDAIKTCSPVDSILYGFGSKKDLPALNILAAKTSVIQPPDGERVVIGRKSVMALLGCSMQDVLAAQYENKLLRDKRNRTFSLTFDGNVFFINRVY